MAFDFPNSPSVGSTYTAGGVTYRWDGQAWMGGPIASAGTKVSMLQTPPASPAPGDLWWETDTGNLFVYYDDGSSSQWVQMNYVPPSDYLAKFAKLIDQRNILYDGSFEFSQRAGYAIKTVSGDEFVDGWNFTIVGSGAAVSAQGYAPASAGPLQRGRVRAQLKCTTAKGSLAAGDIWQLTHTIEGTDISPLKWGTADAVPAILRFGFKGPAGTYGVSIINSPINDRSWVGLFTIAAGEANTDKIIQLAIPGTTTGTWGAGISAAATFRIALASGSTYQGTAGWQAGNFVTTAAQFNGLNSASNVIEVFDVRLIPDFDNLGAANDVGYPVPEYAAELARCQRYFCPATVSMVGYSAAGATIRQNFFLPVTMRANPTLAVVGAVGTLTNCSAFTLVGLGTNGFAAQATVTALGNATVAGTTISCDATM